MKMNLEFPKGMGGGGSIQTAFHGRGGSMNNFGKNTLMTDFYMSKFTHCDISNSSSYNLIC